MKVIKLLYIVGIIIGVVSTSAIAQTSTTTVTVNGNTTTTTTITNTPISTTTTPNTPNIGDITTTTTNQTTTDTLTKIANTNSGNLVPTNFCDNSWTGTQKTVSPSGQTSDLGCNYITGKSSPTYLENSFNLSDKGITKQEQNLGLTQSASAYTHHFWGWNSYLNFSHSITNNDTGATITQNRVWNHNNSIPGSTKNLDNIIIGENSASGFTSKIRFDLSSSGGGATWQGVDISQPNLSITYNKLTSTSLTEQTVSTIIIPCESLGTCYVPPAIEQPKIQITTTSQSIDEQIKTTPYQNSITGEVYGMTPPTITSDISVNKTSTETVKMETQATNTALTGDPSKTETPTTTKSEVSTSTAMTKEEPKTSTSTKESNATTSTTQETASTSKTTDTKTESSSEKSSTSTTQSASTENSKTEGSTTKTSDEKNVSTKENTVDAKGVSSVDIKIKAAIEKVERELKSIEDKTKAIQEIKLDAIKSGAPNLAVYENRSFYEPKYYNGVPNPDFYLQADISQRPVYANVTLEAYVGKDPIAKQQIAMQQIQDEMNDIIIQLEELKRK